MIKRKDLIQEFNDLLDRLKYTRMMAPYPVKDDLLLAVAAISKAKGYTEAFPTQQSWEKHHSPNSAIPAPTTNTK